jgi:DNA-binding beta-propeller fold protein YncE
MDRRDFLRLGAGGIAISVLPLTACTGAGLSLVESGPGALAIADDGTRYELVPDRHHFLITPPGGTPRRVGGLGSAPGQLNYPAAIALVGSLAYVVDLGNHRVQAFDRDGVCQGVLGEGELMYPSGIAARDGRLFVADTGHGELVELSPAGGVIRRFGGDAMMTPRSVAVAGDHLLVADVGLRQVLELRDDGSAVRAFGDDWVLPYGVASDGDAVYVADRSRPELAVFDRGGRLTDTVPLTMAPSYVTLDRDGQLFVG